MGIKLEVTHICNLRCPFCYTDSPRHTREKTPDLTDDEWRSVVQDAIDSGVLEAVITGGEPLLRRALTLELIEKLTSSGIGVTLNTNGWFLDEPTAAALASIHHLNVNVSLDGASPELHDTARGMRQSWSRAVKGIDALVRHGATVRALHVVTPANERFVEPFLEHLWLLGVGSVRLTRVARVGGAAREGRWDVDQRRLRRLARSYSERRSGRFPISVTAATAAGLAALEDLPPQAVLVRPDGAVRPDSMIPFAFGRVPQDSLMDVWASMIGSWPPPALEEWASKSRHANDLGDGDLVAYLDKEAGPDGSRSESARSEVSVPAGVPASPEDPGLEAAKAQIVELALAREYRRVDCRVVPDASGGVVVRSSAGRTSRLNSTVATVFDVCSGGAGSDAVATLCERHPSQTRSRVEEDVIDSVRLLVERRLLIAAGATPR